MEEMSYCVMDALLLAKNCYSPSLYSSLTSMYMYSRPAPFLGSSLPWSLAIMVVFPHSLSPVEEGESNLETNLPVIVFKIFHQVIYTKCHCMIRWWSFFGRSQNRRKRFGFNKHVMLSLGFIGDLPSTRSDLLAESLVDELVCTSLRILALQRKEFRSWLDTLI